MDTHAKSLNGAPLLEIENDIDHSTADAFDWRSESRFDGQNRLLLELTCCPYLDSGGMAVMWKTARPLRPDGRLGIFGRGSDVYRLLQIGGLTADPSFRVFAGPDEASAALSTEPA